MRRKTAWRFWSSRDLYQNVSKYVKICVRMGHWNGVVWIYFEDVFIILSSTLVIDTPSKLTIYNNQTRKLLLNSPLHL